MNTNNINRNFEVKLIVEHVGRTAVKTKQRPLLSCAEQVLPAAASMSTLVFGTCARHI